MSRIATTIALAAGVATATASFEPHLGWVTIGDAGNRAANIDEAPRNFPPLTTPALEVGAVDYEYRIMRAELTVKDYLPFVNAFARHYYGGDIDTSMTSSWIVPSSPGPDGNRTYSNNPVVDRRSADVRNPAVAMAYVNWLHNDRGSEFEDFTTGAYDLRRAWLNDGQTMFLPQTHEPDARYWIPTIHEMVKASYWDPEKNDGEGGYWRYPHRSDEPPVPGLPGEGEAYIDMGSFFGQPDVGSYPDVQSPWGLLDAAGLQGDYTLFDAGGVRPLFWGFGGSPLQDVTRARIDWAEAVRGEGLRIATRVPGPGVGVVLAIGGVLISRRRAQPVA